jgi:hypothetical protein
VAGERPAEKVLVEQHGVGDMRIGRPTQRSEALCGIDLAEAMQGVRGSFGDACLDVATGACDHGINAREGGGLFGC